MHPKQICKDFETLGSPISVEGNNLYIENPEKVYPELEEFAKSRKSILVSYLKGEYTDQDYNVDQTIEKIINFYRVIGQPMDKQIDQWLHDDEDSRNDFMTLCKELADNGWTLHEPFYNYQDENTKVLSKKIYKRAMAFFKGG